MCPSSQRPQCVFQVEVPAARSAAATPLSVLRLLPCYRLHFLHDLARWAPASSSLPSVTAPTRATRRAPALAASPPPALLPRVTRCICFEPCLLSTFRTRSRRIFTRLTSTPPRCSSQRWPAFAGPSRVAEKAAGIWPQGAVDCQSSSRASPEAGDPPASVLFCGCCILNANARMCPRMPPLPGLRIAVFSRSVNAVVVASWATGHCLRPVWLSQRLK